MTVLHRWLTDPIALLTLVIAVASGGFALWQLRWHPAERRRQLLNDMTETYRYSRDARSATLERLPPLMLRAYMTLAAKIEGDVKAAGDGDSDKIDDLQGSHLRRLEREAGIWTSPKVGVSLTAAHEVLKSEFKFRALLWCSEQLGDQSSWKALGLSDDLLKKARDGVDQLNDFVFAYENGVYSPQSLLGQLHASIACFAAAVQPIVWSGRGTSRWGRRVLRIGIAAQHYNDVSGLHRVSDITWRSSIGGNVVVHPKMTLPLQDHEIIDPESLTGPRVLPMLRIRVRAGYWRLVGFLRPKPRAFWAYGGRRLRLHKRAERRLVPTLQYALAPSGSGQYSALDLSWSLEGLREEMQNEARKARAQLGRRAWLYASRMSS